MDAGRGALHAAGVLTAGGVGQVQSRAVPGFVTVRAAGVELSGSQTLTIPIEIWVGGLEETITVAGETLVVGVQSARRELVLNADVVQRFRPRATPGVNVSDAACRQR